MKLQPKTELDCLTVGSPEQRRQCAAPRGDLRYAVLAERQWRREAWAEAQHVKSVERLAREAAEAQREWDRSHRNFKVKTAPNASSVYAVPCGRTQCDNSLRFTDMWRIHNSKELHRPLQYKEECHTTAAPFLLHFNGASKRVVKEWPLQSWLASAHPLPRKST